MAGGGRRLAVRATLAVLAVAASLISAVGSVQAAGSQLNMTGKVGDQSTVKQGQWMPVVIDVTNTGSALDATLEIETGGAQGGPGGPPTGLAVYHWPLSLGAGATKHVRTYVLMDQFPGAMAMRVVDRGRVIESQNASGGNTSGMLLGVLSDRPGTLDGLSSVHLGTFTPTVTHISADELPDTALMLRAFDLLAIDDFATDTLTASQRAALADYVMNGGALLLGTGGSWHKTLAGLPASIVPTLAIGSTILGATTAFGGLPGLEVATGSPTGANVWLAQRNHPLLIDKPTVPHSLTQPTSHSNQIPGWSVTPPIRCQAVVPSAHGTGSVP